MDRLIKFGDDFPGTIFLRGNHEQMLLDAIEEVTTVNLPELTEKQGLQLYDSGLEMFLCNGGRETLRSYDLSNVEDIPEAHLDFILFHSAVKWRDSLENGQPIHC